jgi:hypothetical protein
MFYPNFKIIKLQLLIVFLIFISQTVWSAPSTTSRYYQDPQISYNDDQTSRVFGLVKTVSCFLQMIRPEYNANQLEYVAWVKYGKCDDGGGSTSNSDSLPYEKAVIQSTYSSSTQVLNVKMWLTGSEENGNGAWEDRFFWVNVNITAGPLIAPPLGRWEINMCAQSTPQTTENSDPASCLGYAHATVTPDAIRVYSVWTDGQGQRSEQVGVASYAVANSEVVSGEGQFRLVDSWRNANKSYQFAFSGDYMRLKSIDNVNSSNSSEICTNRNIGARSPIFGNWDGWLYNENTGEPIELAGGFNLKLAPGNVTDWSKTGWLSYWGVWFRDTDNSGNAITLTPGQVLYSDSRSNRDTPYIYKTSKGSLNKVSNTKDNFDSMKNTRFSAYLPVRMVEGGTSNNWASFSTYWDGTAFKTEGKYSYSTNGQQSLDTSSAYVRTLAISVITGSPYFKYDVSGHIPNTNISIRFQLGGWSTATNSMVTYNPAAALSSSNPAYVYRTVYEDVFPGDPESGSPDLASHTNGFVCYGNDCPTMSGSTISAAPGYWSQGANVSSAVNYSWDNSSGNLVHGSSDVASSTYRQVGPLFLGTPSGLECDYWDQSLNGGIGGNASGICPWKANDAGITYYIWKTQTENKWSPTRSFVLKQSNNKRPVFDKPIDVTYTPTSGDLAGKEQILTYNGGGQFWLPSDCYDFDSRQKISCNGSNNNIFWASQFNIPFTTAAAGKVTSYRTPGTKYLVKFGRRSFVYGVENISACSDLTTPTTMTLPTAASWQDPKAINSSAYIGSWRQPIASPLYVDGKEQR